MAKILEEGKSPFEVRCTGAGNGGNGCGALVVYERDELRYYKESDWGPKSAVCSRCPSCGAITDLPRDQWPQNYTQLTPFSTRWRDGKELNQSHS